MKVELSLHAVGLKNVAGLGRGKSDPFAVVTHIATAKGSSPNVLGKTEVIKNTLSPQFTKVFVFEYELGTPMRVAISIFDEVRKGDNKSMGAAVFDIGEILGARGQTKAKRLQKGGTVFAHVHKSEGTGMLRLKLKGIKLKSTEGMGLLRKSDPFFELSRQINAAGSSTWDNVFRSDHIKNNLNPEWGDALVELSTLCGGDLGLPIQVSIFDHESSGKHVLMGKFETSVNALVAADTGGSEDMGKAISVTVKGKETGKIVVLKAQVAGVGDSMSERMSKVAVSATEAVPSTFVPGASKPSFLDYIGGGCELNVAVAIDFTGSNGDPRKPGTLHHMSSESKNDYELAISSILGVLAKYDSDKRFPVYGFGAKYDGVVQHCFQVGPSEEASGVSGVLAAYNQVFTSGLIMSSPTQFIDVMQTTAARATRAQETAAKKGKQAYTILLIVTDGAVSDSQATAACLQQISDAPLSIVIVGVGDADFTSMEFLDDANKTGQRDIAQFVQFNKHRTSGVDLTSVTLREIPGQVVDYFQSKNIQPLPAVVATEEDIIVEEAEEEIDLSLDLSEDEIVVSAGGNDFRDGFA